MHSYVGAQKLLFIHFSHIILISSNCIVTGISFRDPNFTSFSLSDLKRMKDTDKWLSDSHVNFILMFVLLFLFCLHLNDTQGLFS
jgi:hypothetical protein